MYEYTKMHYMLLFILNDPHIRVIWLLTLCSTLQVHLQDLILQYGEWCLVSMCKMSGNARKPVFRNFDQV